MSGFRSTVVALVLAAFVLAADVHAQVSLPGVPVPPVRLPGVDVAGTVDDTLRTADRALESARRLRVAELLRTQRARVERDPRGAPAIRSEVLAFDPAQDALARALERGFTVARERVLDGLDSRVVVLRAPPGWSTRRAVRELRSADPDGSYEYNHLYFESAAVDAGHAAGAAPAAAPPAGTVHARATTGDAASTSGPGTAVRIGMIDGGVNAAHPALRGVSVLRRGCEGRAVPSTHGTAVASLLAGRAERFAGAAPGATLLAADVYCGDAAGGAADEVAGALAWLAKERAGVINVSLVGPPNRVLGGVVAKVLARGHTIVAAVGNDGPAAPPLYPAAYPGVVAVTGVDARGRALPEACRGAHVAFAAPGAEVAAADLHGRYAAMRGTSFAAPLVAGLLALERAAGDSTDDTAVATLAARARDLGAPGRDRVYGFGLVTAELRRDATAVAAAGR